MSNQDDRKEWDDFIDNVIDEVHTLILNPLYLQTFRDKIGPFAERWEEYHSHQKDLIVKFWKHWEQVQSKPYLRDKEAGCPGNENDWIWDADVNLDKIFPGAVVRRNSAGYKSRLGFLGRPVAVMPRQLAAKCLKKMQGNERSDLEKRLRQYDGDMIAITLMDQWWRWFGKDSEKVCACWRPKTGREDDWLTNPVDDWFGWQPNAQMPKLEGDGELERDYAFLAWHHDNAVARSPFIVKGIWPKDLEGAMAIPLSGGWRKSGTIERWVELGLEAVKRDLEGTHKGKAPSPQGSKKSKASSENRFKPWLNPPHNTCFILSYDDTNTKLLFCHEHRYKNLCIDNKSHAIPLLIALRTNTSLSNKEIQEYLETKTKASKIVSRSNGILNRQIQKSNEFDTVPKDRAFIGKHDGGNYISHLDVHVVKSKTDLRLKLEELGIDQQNAAS